MSVEVRVDEEYNPRAGRSFLRVRSIDTKKGLESNILTIRSASPQSISESLMSTACYLEEDPPDELDPGSDKLKDLIEFYKESAANVPGLK